MSKTIIIADDHPITARGMKSVFLNMGYDVLGDYQNGLQAFNQIVLQRPKYVLLDAHMPGMNGIDILEEINNKKINIKTVMYTMYTDVGLFQKAKELGVNGYLLKEFALEDLKTCFDSVEKGNNWYHPDLEGKLTQPSSTSFNADLYCTLSTRERGIVAMIADNKSTKLIAKEQFISEKTVETHRRNIKHKLQLSDERNALLVWAVKNKGFFTLFEE